MKENTKIKKSRKLEGVCYDIRGPVLDEAERMEKNGEKILKLNIGNPSPFGFKTPSKIINNISEGLKKIENQGYSHSKGIIEARQNIADSCKNKNISNVNINDIYIGNGISELITMTMQGLLNNGEEVLIPSPDYPLWTAAVNLAGGKSVHYVCDEKQNWIPDIKDIEKRITKKTKGIIVINPNNPTGAVYPKSILEKIVKIAKENNLIIFADEIYDQILYDNEKHTSIASITNDVLFITFNGLSKNYYMPGFRAGWIVISGNKKIAKDYIEGLEILANMRLCSNVPAQLAIKPALNQNHKKLIEAKNKLEKRRNLAYKLLTEIPGISCIKPKAAFYMFPKIDIKKFDIVNDEKFVLDFLRQEKILLVQGTGFNWSKPDHFRVVFLPKEDKIKLFSKKLKNFLVSYKQTK